VDKDSKVETHSNSSSRKGMTIDIEVGVDAFDSMNLIECRRIFSNARSTLPQIREAASSSLERLSLVGVVTGCKRKGKVADVRRRAVQLLSVDTKPSTER
jgi:hypothetical protein